MKTSITSLVSTLVLAAAALPATAASYDFANSNPLPDAGTAFACTGGDLCSKATPHGGAMTFAAGTFSAAGYYFNGANWTNATTVLDLNGNNPKWVGLGVYHQTTGTAADKGFVRKDDNITKNEALVLSFAEAVTLKDVVLRAEGHAFNFDTKATFGISTDLLAPSDAGITKYNFNNVNGFVDVADITSNTFVFYGFSDLDKNQYYLSALNVVAVPEPETYALMLAGLGVVGFLARRRKV